MDGQDKSKAELLLEDEPNNYDENEDVVEWDREGSLLLDHNKSISRHNIDNDAKGRFIFYTLVVAAEGAAIACVGLVLIWTLQCLGGFSWDGPKQFNYHPLFMVIGMVVLSGNSVIVYRVLRHQEKYTVKIIHTCLHFAGFIFTFIGLIAVFDFHNKNNDPNMYSLHSWVGMASVVLYSCQLLFGFLCFLFPTFESEKRRLYLGIHVFFGCVIFASSIGACISGITEEMLFQYMATYSKFPSAGIVANLLGLSLVIFSVLVGYILYNPSYKVLFWRKAF